MSWDIFGLLCLRLRVEFKAEMVFSSVIVCFLQEKK